MHSAKHILSLIEFQWEAVAPTNTTLRSISLAVALVQLDVATSDRNVTHSKRKSGWRTYLHHSTEQTACCGPAAICSFT